MALDRNDTDLMAYKNAKTEAERNKYAGKLLQSNKLLVHKLVTKYGRNKGNSVEYDDLYQAGCIAFLRSLEKTDPARKLSTLLAYWVRYEISKVVDKSTVITNVRNAVMPYKLQQLSATIRNQTGRDATAEELGVTQAKLDQYNQVPSTTSIDVELVEGAGLHNVIASEASNPEEQCSANEDEIDVGVIMQWLTAEQKQVINSLYHKGATHEELAKTLRKTVKEIRAIEDSALAVMAEEYEQ